MSRPSTSWTLCVPVQFGRDRPHLTEDLPATAQLGVAPATDKQFTANIPNDIGPEGRLYKIYVNATPAGFGFSQSDL
jgi:hypothetical protein